ncbi:MAG TPA: hypothetical protein PLO33_01410 [Kouleothrix sp.]|nr:hypothetical protein [Kouleothrix sp.]
MEDGPASADPYMALVVRVEPDNAGGWVVVVANHTARLTAHLVPATLVVRLWRSVESDVLRGTVWLAGTEYTVAVQTQTAALELLRAWFGLAESHGPAA